MRIPPLIVTREHGSWALLVVPLVTGAAHGHFTWLHAFLATSATAFFMSYVPAQTLLRGARGQSLDEGKRHAARFWGAVYVAVGSVSLIPLLMEGLWMLVVIGASAMLLFAITHALNIRKSTSVVGNLIAMLGLTLGAPAAYYVGAGVLDRGALFPWIANILFFASSVFYVDMKIRGAPMKGNRTIGEVLRVGKHNLVFITLLWALVAIGGTITPLPPMAYALFLPMSIHGVWGTVTLGPKTNFKRLGLVLLAQSVVFGGMVMGIGRLP